MSFTAPTKGSCLTEVKFYGEKECKTAVTDGLPVVGSFTIGECTKDANGNYYGCEITEKSVKVLQYADKDCKTGVTVADVTVESGGEVKCQANPSKTGWATGTAAGWGDSGSATLMTAAAAGALALATINF